MAEIKPGDKAYEIAENPVYDPVVRALKTSDPANADTVFNPLFQQLINNTHAVKLSDEEKIEKAVEDTKSWAVQEFSNPNLLINGDFQVWQRGTSFIDMATNTYTADRWGVHDNQLRAVERIINTSEAPCTYAAKLSFRALHNQFCQPIEGCEALNGKTVTLSFWMKGTGATNMSVIIGNTEKRFTITQEWKRYQIISVFTSGNITRMKGVSFGNMNFSEGCNVELAGVKLELGSYATPFVPRSYGEELALCQRYYEKATRISCNQTDGGMLEHTKYTATKRISPIIKIHAHGSNTEDNVGAWNGTAYSDCPCVVDIGTTDGFRTRALSSNIPPGTVNLDFWYTADAEIY